MRVKQEFKFISKSFQKENKYFNNDFLLAKFTNEKKHSIIQSRDYFLYFLLFFPQFFLLRRTLAVEQLYIRIEN